MILSKLYLSPLGAFSKKQLDFTPGMNVVLGPNEAGKSTLFNAVRLALLVPTDLPKREREKKIDPYLPVSGGDFVRVAVELHKGGDVFRLIRRWGTDPSSKLDLPGGGSLSDDEKVREKLAELLPARPGTMEHVLMTRQSMLGRTLESFDDEARESIADFSDILRRAVLETGGVSVDRFLEKVKSERDRAFLRWNRLAGGPEKSKGTQKRWAKGYGTVLGAWYALEKAREDRQRAAAWEDERDALNARLRAAAAEQGAAETFLREHETAAKGAGEQRALEAELAAVAERVRALEQAVVKWPVAADRARQLREAIGHAEDDRSAMEKEHREAQNALEANALRERHARALRLKATVDQTRARRSALPRMEKKTLADIRAAVSSLSRLEAGLEAGRISVTVAGRAPGELLTQEDFSPEQRTTIGPNRTLSLSAAGRVRIVHKDLEIEVRSGDAEAQARAEKAAAARAALADLLKRHGASSLETAEEYAAAWEETGRALSAAEKALAEDLGSDALPELDARVAALGVRAEARPVQVVAEALVAVRTQAAADARALADLEREIEEWRTSFGSVEKLLEAHAAAKRWQTDLQSQIARSGSLPPGFADAGSFVRAYEKAQEDVHRLRGEIDVLELRKRGMEKQPEAWGDQSAEELAAQASDSEEAFMAELRRAEALDRVAQRSSALLGSTDGAITSGLTSRLAEMLSAMTGGRHSELVMQGPLPVALSEGDGVSLRWDQLSAGTRDTLALALRLAMADYFLGAEDGFMLLDDPLVDMDPDRQKAAAAALKAFAARRQLIVFTCHPVTAALLGAKPIMLSGPASPPR